MISNMIIGEEDGNALVSGGVTVAQFISPRRGSKRRKLGLKDVSQKFVLPISEAAKELGVSVTTLKLRCRELGIAIWPYRKLRSLENLVKTVVELEIPGYDFIVGKLRKEIEAIKVDPSLKIEDPTERFRQEIYDMMYKRRMMDIKNDE